MPPKTIFILIVNPSVLLRRLLQKHLGELGYKNLAQAPTPIEAAVILRGLVPQGKAADLVIAEEMLDQTHGPAWLSALVQDAQLTALRGIFLTSEDEPQKAMPPNELYAFLRRPFSLESLANRMRDVFRDTGEARRQA